MQWLSSEAGSPAFLNLTDYKEGRYIQKVTIQGRKRHEEGQKEKWEKDSFSK